MSPFEAVEHSGTWRAESGGYVDFILRGPRPRREGIPGPLSVYGLVLPFRGFLPKALLWADDSGGEQLVDELLGFATEQILTGSFTWAEMTYLVSFIYFEDSSELKRSGLSQSSSS